MPLVRMIVSSNLTATSPSKDAIVNTLYFNVSGSLDEPGYTGLVNDLYSIWGGNPWSSGRFLDIRAYDMSDAKPREVKARKTGQVTGTSPNGPHQIALCLSYYADRNLPSQRGRIYVGPWSTPGEAASSTSTGLLISLASALAGLGGLNVDWSLYSPKKGTHTRISMAWVDDSWDIIRARKLAPVAARKTIALNG